MKYLKKYEALRVINIYDSPREQARDKKFKYKLGSFVIVLDDTISKIFQITGIDTEERTKYRYRCILINNIEDIISSNDWRLISSMKIESTWFREEQIDSSISKDEIEIFLLSNKYNL